MLLEDFAVAAGLRFDGAGGEARHDLAKDRSVILRLGLPRRLLDTKSLEVSTQARKRPLIDKPGQVVGAVGQDFAPSQADKEIEVLPSNAFDIRLRCRLSKCGMRQAKWA